MIPAKEAVILWNCAVRGVAPSDDVLVLPLSESASTMLYDCSAGAVGASWCTGDDARDYPDGLFGHVIFNAPEPLPRSTVFAWLEQFAKIDECEWARQMLAEMVRQNTTNAA